MFGIKKIRNLTVTVGAWGLDFTFGFAEEIIGNITNVEPAGALDTINIDKSKVIQTTALLTASKITSTNISSKLFYIISGATVNHIV